MWDEVSLNDDLEILSGVLPSRSWKSVSKILTKERLGSALSFLTSFLLWFVCFIAKTTHGIYPGFFPLDYFFFSAINIPLSSQTFLQIFFCSYLKTSALASIIWTPFIFPQEEVSMLRDIMHARRLFLYRERTAMISSIRKYGLKSFSLIQYPAVSPKVVPRKWVQNRDNADWYFGSKSLAFLDWVLK